MSASSLTSLDDFPLTKGHPVSTSKTHGKRTRDDLSSASSSQIPIKKVKIKSSNTGGPPGAKRLPILSSGSEVERSNHVASHRHAGPSLLVMRTTPSLTGNAYLDEYKRREHEEAEADQRSEALRAKAKPRAKEKGKGKSKEGQAGLSGGTANEWQTEKKMDKKKKEKEKAVEIRPEEEGENAEENEGDEFLVDAILSAHYCNHSYTSGPDPLPSPSWTYIIKWHNFLFEPDWDVEKPITARQFGNRGGFIKLFWEDLGMDCVSVEKGKSNGQGKGKAKAGEAEGNEEEEDWQPEPVGRVGDEYRCSPRLLEWHHRLAAKAYDEDQVSIGRAMKTLLSMPQDHRTAKQKIALDAELFRSQQCKAESERMRIDAGREAYDMKQTIMQESRKSLKGPDAEGDEYVPWLREKRLTRQEAREFGSRLKLQGRDKKLPEFLGQSSLRAALQPAKSDVQPPKKKKKKKDPAPTVTLPEPSRMTLPPTHSDRMRERERPKSTTSPTSNESKAKPPNLATASSSTSTPRVPLNRIMSDSLSPPPSDPDDSLDAMPKSRTQTKPGRVVASPPQLFAPDPESEPDADMAAVELQMGQAAQEERPKPRSRQSYAPIWESGKAASSGQASSAGRSASDATLSAIAAGVNSQAGTGPPSATVRTLSPAHMSNGLLDGPPLPSVSSAIGLATKSPLQNAIPLEAHAFGLPPPAAKATMTGVQQGTTAATAFTSSPGESSTSGDPRKAAATAQNGLRPPQNAPTTPPGITATVAQPAVTAPGSTPGDPRRAGRSVIDNAPMQTGEKPREAPRLGPTVTSNMAKPAAPSLTTSGDPRSAHRPVAVEPPTQLAPPAANLPLKPSEVEVRQEDEEGAIATTINAVRMRPRNNLPALNISEQRPLVAGSDAAVEQGSGAMLKAADAILPFFFTPPGMTDRISLGSLRISAADSPANNWQGLTGGANGSLTIELSRIVDPNEAAKEIKRREVLQRWAFSNGDDASKAPFQALLEEVGSAEPGQIAMVAIAQLEGFPDITVLIHNSGSLIDPTPTALPLPNASRPHLRAILIRLDSRLDPSKVPHIDTEIMHAARTGAKEIIEKLPERGLKWAELEAFGFTEEWFLRLQGTRVVVLGDTALPALVEALKTFRVPDPRFENPWDPNDETVNDTFYPADTILVDHPSVSILLKNGASVRAMVDQGTKFWVYGPKEGSGPIDWVVKRILEVSGVMATFSPKFILKEPELMLRIVERMSALQGHEVLIIPQILPLLNSNFEDPMWCLSAVKARMGLSKLWTSPAVKISIPISDRPSNLFKARQKMLANSFASARGWTERVELAKAQPDAPNVSREAKQNLFLGTIYASPSVYAKSGLDVELAQLLDLSRRAERPTSNPKSKLNPVVLEEGQTREEEEEGGLTFPRCVYVGSDRSLIDGFAGRFGLGVGMYGIGRVERVRGEEFLRSLGGV